MIAQQEIDAITAKERSAQASLGALREQVKAAAADVKKLKTMLEYTRIVTPFAGVITERYADKGSLIQAGTSAQSIPLVRLSENGKLRLVFPVSVSFVPYIRVGDPVKVEIPEVGRTIEAKITRTAQKVTTSTRTMDTEVEIDNQDYSLIPGMYASVRLAIDRKDHALVVPVEALSRQKKATVYVINKDGIIENRTVKLGLETPSKIEVLANLQENELVLIGNRNQVKPGQKVIPKLLTEQLAQEPK